MRLESETIGEMLDREAAIAWYRRNRARSRALFDLARSAERLLQAADRAAPSDRVLRRTPAGVQLQHAGEEGARRPEHRRAARDDLRARDRSARIAGGPKGSGGSKRTRPTADGVGRVLSDPAAAGRRATRCTRSPPRPIGACSTRCAGRTWIVRAIRCSIARKRCSRSSNTKRCTTRRCSTCGIACRSRTSAGPPITPAWRTCMKVRPRLPPRSGSRFPAGRVTLGVDREDLVFGWDNEFPRRIADVGRLLDRALQRDQRAIPGIRRGRRLRRRAMVARGRLELDSERTHLASAVLGARRGRETTGRRGGTGGTSGTGETVAKRVVLARHVRTHSAAARVAGLRQLCRGRGLRAVARRPPDDRSRIPAGGVTGPAVRPMANGEYPWGNDRPSPEHGVFDFSSWDPEPVGSHPAGRSAWGVDDLVGNGWEWTSTVFAPFPGFRAMASYPEYSADFFDGEHMVMKGASPATAAELLRPTFRNWFRPRYPYVYATFRCVAERVPRPLRTSRATSSTTWRSSRASCRRAICTTRSGRRSSTRSASCRGTASPAPSSACSRSTAATILAHARRFQGSESRAVEHRRARAGQRDEAADAARDAT